MIFWGEIEDEMRTLSTIGNPQLGQEVKLPSTSSYSRFLLPFTSTGGIIDSAVEPTPQPSPPSSSLMTLFFHTTLPLFQIESLYLVTIIESEPCRFL